MLKIKLLFFGLMSFSLTQNAFAEFKVPALTGPVVDQARVFSQTGSAKLAAILQQLNQSGLVQMQILTVESLEGQTIEQASIQVTDSWKLGDKDRDNGLLLMVAVRDKKVRLEVGQGLEGDIPDALAARVIRGEILPRFKQNDYEGGALAAIAIVQDILAPNLNSEAIEEFKSQKDRKAFFSQIIVLLAIFVIIFLGNRSRGGALGFILGSGIGRGHGGFGGYGGGGFGGGGWSGGGGGFSGGGASGGW